jgi:hypothetical protein
VYHNVTRKRPPTEDSDEPEKKERVIHTRVPESLEAELRRKAQGLGISVSNLVRNVLGHAFGLVGDVVADSHAIARAARGETSAGHGAAPGSAATAGTPSFQAGGQAPGQAIDDVLGWQPMVLGKNAVCVRCNAILPRGSDAAIGVAEPTGARLVICLACLEQLRA